MQGPNSRSGRTGWKYSCSSRMSRVQQKKAADFALPLNNGTSYSAGRHRLWGHTPHFLHEKLAISAESQLLKEMSCPAQCRSINPNKSNQGKCPIMSKDSGSSSSHSHAIHWYWTPLILKTRKELICRWIHGEPHRPHPSLFVKGIKGPSNWRLRRVSRRMAVTQL